MTPESQEFLATFVSESYYYWASVFMLLIHVGFLAYEGGASRVKNVLATMLKNLLTLSIVGLTFFFFGWWVYNAFPTLPTPGRHCWPLDRSQRGRCSWRGVGLSPGILPLVSRAWP